MPQTHAVFGELAHCGSEPFDYCLPPSRHTHTSDTDIQDYQEGKTRAWQEKTAQKRRVSQTVSLLHSLVTLLPCLHCLGS